jgi:hypothetical protein
MKKYFKLLLILLFVCFQGYSQDFAVEIKLKPQQVNRSHSIIEDAEIRAISSKHEVEMTQSYPNARTPELLLYYTLTGKGNKESSVRDYLTTGKFEDRVSEFEMVYINTCVNPVSTNEAPGFWSSNGWALNMIQTPCAWSITQGSANVLIGIADTEFDTNHEDFQNKFAGIYGNTSGGYHHGTNVASVAAAATNNGKGIAGVGYLSRIVAHRVFHNPGGANIATLHVRNAIWALYQLGVPIINVSFSGTGLTEVAAEEITQYGTTLVLAGGNDVSSQDHKFIADIPGVIVVSSVDRNNMHGPTGHARNQWIDICAPGIDILVANVGNVYSINGGSGTSIAAPFVSGTIALMLSVNPDLTPAQIENIIKSTADPIADGNSFPGQLGAGRLNAYKALLAVPPYISGSTTLCTNEEFSVTNAPSGFTWNKSSNLLLSGSGSTVTVTPIGSGAGWVSINSGGVELARKNVSITGTYPTPTSTSVNVSGSYQYVSIDPPNYNYNYYFYVDSDFPYCYLMADYGNCVTASVMQPGNYTVTAHAINNCGETHIPSYTVTISATRSASNSGFLVYPNPVKDILTVDIDPSVYVSAGRAAPDYDVRLYDGRGSLLRQEKTKGGKLQLDVSNLPNATYYLHIYEGTNSKPEMMQILVRH